MGISHLWISTHSFWLNLHFKAKNDFCDLCILLAFRAFRADNEHMCCCSLLAGSLLAGCWYFVLLCAFPKRVFCNAHTSLVLYVYYLCFSTFFKYQKSGNYQNDHMPHGWFCLRMINYSRLCCTPTCSVLSILNQRSMKKILELWGHVGGLSGS